MAALPRLAATLLVLMLGVAGVLLVLFAWRLPPFRSAIETTDDAYVRGFVTGISPQVAGLVAEIPVHDYEDVTAGTTLVRLDDRPFRARLAQAEAQRAAAQASLDVFGVQVQSAQAGVKVAEAAVRSAQAGLEKAQEDDRRIEPLVQRQFQSQAAADAVRAALRQAEAALAQQQGSQAVAEQELARVRASRAGLEAAVQAATAASDLARLDLDYTTVRAPRAGRLGEVSVRVGAYVTAGSQLTYLVPPETWVIANYKETQVGAMQPGQAAEIEVDALRGRRFTGQIERFSPATGSEFSVLRPDNATGNFTKVAQRVPLRIAFDPGQAGLDRLSPGMSVEVRIDTGQAMRTASEGTVGGVAARP